MTKIISKSGAVETNVGGDSYAFQRDAQGYFTAEVHNLKHIECFLAVDAHYALHPDEGGDQSNPVAVQPEPNDDDPDTDPAKGGETSEGDDKGEQVEEAEDEPKAAEGGYPEVATDTGAAKAKPGKKLKGAAKAKPGKE